MPRAAKACLGVVIFVLVTGLSLPGCPWFKMMNYQQSRDGYSYDTDDYNGEGPKRPSMRMPVEGTVPIDGGDMPVSLLDADQLVRNPVPGSPESAERGEGLFRTFCSPCHGKGGQGDGLVGRKFPFVPSLLTDQAKKYTDPYLYTMIRQGRGLMPSYGPRVTPEERWDIVNYVRKLQGAPSKVAAAGTPGSAD
jgi:mono/diheme cytochrome c family protein